MKRVLGLSIVAGLLTLVVLASPVHAQAGAGLIVSYLNKFLATTHTWTAGQGSSVVNLSTANQSFPLYRGVTTPDTYYTSDFTSVNSTLNNGVNRSLANLVYYKYAPTDSDAGGLGRVSLYGYFETGGTQNLSGTLQALRGRLLNFNTGTSTGDFYGLEGTVFNGHAGQQASTGGPVGTMTGVYAGVFHQSVAGTVNTEYGVQTIVENDYGTTITTAYGDYVVFFGSVLPTTSYGVYVDTVLGSTKWAFYNNDAASPSRSLSNWRAPFLANEATATLTISSNTIAPANAIVHVGAGALKTITVPTMCAPTCTISLIPDSAFTYDATGNIIVPAGSGTAVVNRVMTMTWDGTKWYPSY